MQITLERIQGSITYPWDLELRNLSIVSARNQEQMGARKESQTSDQEETGEVSRSLNGSTETELHFEGKGGTQVLKARASQSDVLKS